MWVFGFVLAFILIIAIVGYNKIKFVEQTVSAISDINAVKQRYAINFRGSVHDRAIAIRDIVLLDDIEEIEKTLKLIQNLEEFYKDSAIKMDEIFRNPTMVDAKDKEVLEQIKKVESKTMPLILEILTKKAQGDLVEANALLINQARNAFTEWLGIINVFIDHQEAKIKP